MGQLAEEWKSFRSLPNDTPKRVLRFVLWGKNSTAQTKRLCGCGGMVDTPDLGSGASNSASVRVSPSARKRKFIEIIIALIQRSIWVKAEFTPKSMYLLESALRRYAAHLCVRTGLGYQGLIWMETPEEEMFFCAIIFVDVIHLTIVVDL